MLLARTVGWRGAQVQVHLKSYFRKFFLYPTFLQVLVSIALTLSSTYLPWRLKGKPMGMMRVVRMMVRMVVSMVRMVRMVMVMVLTTTLQVSEGDDGGICCSLPTGGRS